MEPALDGFVEHADDAVELGDVEVLEQRAADEVAVAVGADREVRAVHRVAALQQEPVQLLVVRGRVGQEVELVAQRALVEVEVDRRRVPALAPEPHVPARDARVVLDGLHPRLARDGPFEVLCDQRVLGREERFVENGSSTHTDIAGTARATRSP